MVHADVRQSGASASAFAALTPTSSAPARPGPCTPRRRRGRRGRRPPRRAPPRSRRRSARRARGSRSRARRRRSGRAGRPGSTRPTSGRRARPRRPRRRSRRTTSRCRGSRVTSASAVRTTVSPGTPALDAVEQRGVLGLVDLVRPHHERVLVDLRVVVLAHADRREPEPPVQVLRAVVRHPDLERERRRVPRDRLAREREQQPRADLVPVPARVDRDRRDVPVVERHHQARRSRRRRGRPCATKYARVDRSASSLRNSDERPRPRVHLLLDAQHRRARGAGASATMCTASGSTRFAQVRHHHAPLPRPTRSRRRSGAGTAARTSSGAQNSSRSKRAVASSTSADRLGAACRGPANSTRSSSRELLRGTAATPSPHSNAPRHALRARRRARRACRPRIRTPAARRRAPAGRSPRTPRGGGRRAPATTSAAAWRSGYARRSRLGIGTTGIRSAWASTLAVVTPDPQPGEQPGPMPTAIADEVVERRRRSSRAQVLDRGRELLGVARTRRRPGRQLDATEHARAPSRARHRRAGSRCRSRAPARQRAARDSRRLELRAIDAAPPSARREHERHRARRRRRRRRRAHVERGRRAAACATASPHSTSVTARPSSELVEPEVVQLLEVVEPVDVDVHEREPAVVLAARS